MGLRKNKSTSDLKKVWFIGYYKLYHRALQGVDAAGTSLKYEDKKTWSLDQMQH